MSKRRIKLPRSARKFIRKEKARLRREIFDKKEYSKRVAQLYRQFSKQLRQ